MKPMAIYHVVRSNEGFEESAQILFKLVQDAQARLPGCPRHLYLDIEGHRNQAGGFDADMYELQKDFLIGVLAEFLTEVSCPLVPQARNPNGQNDDIPPRLEIRKPDDPTP